MNKTTKLWARILAIVLALLMLSGAISYIILYLL